MGGEGGLATINSPTFAPPGVPGAAGGGMNGAPSPRSRSGSRGQGGGQGGQPFPLMQHNLDAPDSNANSPRPSPVVPYAVNSTPALVPASIMSGHSSGPTTPLTPSSSAGSGGVGGSAAAAAAAMAAASANAAASAQMKAGGGKGRKRSVNKSEISEPVFVSSTNKVSTVELPVSAGGMASPTKSPMPQAAAATTFGGMGGEGAGAGAPAVPAMDPRRRTRTGMFWKRRDVSAESESASGGEVLTSSVFDANAGA
ncbi:hypothetical protein V494_07882, partial [Pseudogymnoascus sp. VKM F-4513 (FW-928)]